MLPSCILRRTKYKRKVFKVHVLYVVLFYYLCLEKKVCNIRTDADYKKNSYTTISPIVLGASTTLIATNMDLANEKSYYFQ